MVRSFNLAWTLLILEPSLYALRLGHRDQQAHDQLAAAGHVTPKVGLTFPVHPHKFHMAGQFLEQYVACPAARQAMSVTITFTNQTHLDAFREGLARVHPSIPADAWTAINTEMPFKVFKQNTPGLAAWKKWFGIAHLLDLGTSGPDYGLMTDSELVILNRTDCGPDSHWYSLLDRIKDLEANKKWLAVKAPAPTAEEQLRHQNFTRTVSNHLANTLKFVMGLKVHCDKGKVGEDCLQSCTSSGCDAVRSQHDQSLWSWWTDVPYVNLAVAKRMFEAGSGTAEAQNGKKQHVDWGHSLAQTSSASVAGQWQARMQRATKWYGWEHVAYQQWCMLHEGYTVSDVSNLVGQVGMASYLEHPTVGSRIDSLRPLWVSNKVIDMVNQGQLPPLSISDPPLLEFHDWGKNKTLYQMWNAALPNRSSNSWNQMAE
eukprot:gnl/TRDRNA2_/TRDRNA2_183568_c0_seq1.p1 gnl/TRDRNA2_/TRDRNA2_183568_c0~~gnl/TRDRNA2_/TRDRNA2_183568_c0_seq1.p1  ORF type:complete len:429 (-),score=43.37 gnl/TRDRNA2_/TRDRNA2_183568_c0_seq1:23-1309(-)